MIVYPDYIHMGKKKPKSVLGFLGNADTYEKADWVVTYTDQASRVSKERGVYQVAIKGSSQYAKKFDLVNVAVVRRGIKRLKFDYQKDTYGFFSVQLDNGTTVIYSNKTAAFVDAPISVTVEVPDGVNTINFYNTSGYENMGVYVNNIRFED